MFRGYPSYLIGSGYRTNAGVNPQWKIVRGKFVSSRNAVDVFRGYEILVLQTIRLHSFSLLLSSFPLVFVCYISSDISMHTGQFESNKEQKSTYRTEKKEVCIENVERKMSNGKNVENRKKRRGR